MVNCIFDRKPAETLLNAPEDKMKSSWGLFHFFLGRPTILNLSPSIAWEKKENCNPLFSGLVISTIEDSQVGTFP